MKHLKPMLPTLVSSIPTGEEWLYQVKYDGFRAMVYIDERELSFISRNSNALNEQFPEVVQAMYHFASEKKMLPMILDGELCVLETEFKANFANIQKRGRLKKNQNIKQAQSTLPVTYMVFDVIMFHGNDLSKKTFQDRQLVLENLFENKEAIDHLQLVKTYEDPLFLWEKVQAATGEGIVAKHKKSFWLEGHRSNHWQKIKNLLIAPFFVLAYDEKNSFFHIGCVHNNNEVIMVGKVGQGFVKEEKEALIAIIKKNRIKVSVGVHYVAPSICIEVEFLERGKNELRHPKFRRFRFDLHWEECTWEKVQAVKLN